jgi:hypothetical protein
MDILSGFSWERKLRPDVSEVIEVAAMLDTTEFDIFRKAYASWFGEAANDDKIEGFFVAYMFKEQVPLWVRHFTRPLLAIGRREGGDALEAYRTRRPPTTLMTKLAGGLSTGLIIALLALLVMLAMNAAELKELFGSCYFPPCY